MPEKTPPITRSKSVIFTFISTILLGLYNALDAVSNAEFVLQKLGLSEDVSKFLGSSRGIQGMFWISLVALIISLMYHVRRYELASNQNDVAKSSKNERQEDGEQLNVNFPSLDHTMIAIDFRQDLPFVKTDDNVRRLFVQVTNNTGEPINFFKMEVIDISETAKIGNKSFFLTDGGSHSSNGRTLKNQEKHLYGVAVQWISERQKVQIKNHQPKKQEDYMLAVKLTVRVFGKVNQIVGQAMRETPIHHSKQFVLYIDEKDLLQLKEIGSDAS